MAEKTESNADDESSEIDDIVEEGDVDTSEMLSRMLNSIGLESGLQVGNQRLASLDLEGVANFLKQDGTRIITLAGAGISTAAGIPDFRSPGCGLYDNLQRYNLPNPTAIFDIEFFKKQPEPFFNLAKELYPGRFKPTLTHYFLRLLYDKGLLLRHYSQNIDALERVAGMPPDSVVEAHGSFLTSHCLDCGAAHELAWLKKEVFADRVPRCFLSTDGGKCGGIVKPDIVFFGESLPKVFIQRVAEDFTPCTLLFIMGTSLHVAPFCNLIGQVNSDVPRVYFNKEMSSGAAMESDFMSMLMFGGAGLRCGRSDNYRDVFVQGACDDSCRKLADLLGWKDELEALYRTEHERLDKELANDQDFKL